MTQTLRSTSLVANNLPVPSPLGSLEAYIGAVHRIPVLSVEEEQGLARRFRDEEDLEAARELVHSHLRFVVHVARGYSGYGLQLGDLIQEGNIGLMKAVKRFDPDMAVSYTHLDVYKRQIVDTSVFGVVLSPAALVVARRRVEAAAALFLNRPASLPVSPMWQ